MNYKYILLFSAVIVILICMGYYLTSFDDEANIPELSNETILFDYSSVPITYWNESSHEYKFHQKITSEDNREFENASIDLLFYNQGKLIATESNHINESENGVFDLDFTIKLDAEPDEFYYNVTALEWN